MFVFVLCFFVGATTVKYVTAANDMYPSFDEDDVLVCIKSHHYTYGDVVAFKSFDETSDAYLIKRVYGLPGDTILLQDETVYINGEAIIDEYGYYDNDKEGFVEGIVYTLSDNEYFLLGDNRNYSIDSRSFGGVESSSIFGTVIFNISDFSIVE